MQGGTKKRRAITKKEGTKIVIDPSLPQIIEVLIVVYHTGQEDSSGIFLFKQVLVRSCISHKKLSLCSLNLLLPRRVFSKTRKGIVCSACNRTINVDDFVKSQARPAYQ